MRRAAKTDTTQKTIVEALRKAGYTVEIIKQPVDVMIRKDWWPTNFWVLAELKTPNRKDGYKPRKDQSGQVKFCAKYSVPYFFSVDVALDYLSLYEKFWLGAKA